MKNPIPIHKNRTIASTQKRIKPEQKELVVGYFFLKFGIISFFKLYSILSRNITILIFLMVKVHNKQLLLTIL